MEDAVKDIIINDDSLRTGVDNDLTHSEIKIKIYKKYKSNIRKNKFKVSIDRREFPESSDVIVEIYFNIRYSTLLSDENNKEVCKSVERSIKEKNHSMYYCDVSMYDTTVSHSKYRSTFCNLISIRKSNRYTVRICFKLR